MPQSYAFKRSEAADRDAYAVRALILFAAYVVIARVSLAFDAVGGFAAPVWPPTGIAIAGLLLWGPRLWPVVLAAAFLVNALTGAPAHVAFGIGLGNALEAYVATRLLLRDGRFRLTFDDPRSILSFMALAAGASTLISPTIGVASLRLGGVIGPSAVFDAWQAWWIGDVFGALVIAPILIIWGKRGRYDSLRTLRPRWGEALAILALTAGLLACVFGLRPPYAPGPTAASFLLLIPLLWAGVRFGLRGATATTLLLTVVMVVATATGIGPFVMAEVHDSLSSLNLFVVIAAVIGLLIGSANDERIVTTAGMEGLRMELSERTERLKVMVDTAPVCIKLVDWDFTVLEMNPAGLAMLEADSPDLVVGKSGKHLVAEKDRAAFKDLLDRVREGRSGELRYEAVGLKGGRRVLDMKMVPYREPNGRVIAGLGITRDVTSEVERDALLRARSDELERLNKTLVGRELRMIELKKDLKRRDGDKPSGPEAA